MIVKPEPNQTPRLRMDFYGLLRQLAQERFCDVQFTRRALDQGLAGQDIEGVITTRTA